MSSRIVCQGKLLKILVKGTNWTKLSFYLAGQGTGQNLKNFVQRSDSDELNLVYFKEDEF